MYKFEYEIKIDEETDLPYIYLMDENNYDGSEHKYMALQLTIHQLIELKARYELSENPTILQLAGELGKSIQLLSELSHTMAMIVKKQLDITSEINDILNNNTDTEENDDDDIQTD